MIKLKEKISYGFGDMSSSMFWKIIGMYMLYFYTDVFGLTPAAVGTMFLVTRVWDTLNDPIMGLLADRTNTRWGKFRPFLLWGAVPFAVLGTLTFFVPDLSEVGKLVYAYISYTLLMMVYTFVNVPYASLLGVMSVNSKERNSLSSFRMLFAYLGSFIALGLVEPLVKLFSGSGASYSEARGWLMAVALFGVICAGLFYLCFKGTRERVKPIVERQSSIRTDLIDLLKNYPWWILLGAGVAALIFNSIRDGATIFYFKYYVMQDGGSNIWGGFFTLSSLYLMVGQASNMIGVALAAPMANRFGKKKIYITSMLIATGLSIVFYGFRPDQVVMIFLFQVLISICAGSIFPMLWAMYADIADYSELKTGRRATGLILSSSSMSQKLGWTLGGSITGWLLAYYGFQANVVQGPEAIHGIRMMLSYLPAIGTAMSVVFISMYPLSEKRVKGITEELEKQRSKTK